jgi:chemotaxis protein MotB
MMGKFNLWLAVLASTVVVSCVSTKKYQGLENKLREAETSFTGVQNDLRACRDEKAELERMRASMEDRIKSLNEQASMLKDNNSQALKQLQDLSVISSAQAESIRKSMENMGAKDNYIQSLQQQMARKDSLNMALVMNLKGAIGNLDDKDINIKVDKGVVFIDISDKLLFKTVLKNQPDIEFMVEGHTDDIPFSRPPLVDNWDLSTKRATTVVRMLQKQYGMDPAKMAAAGRAEYHPIADNTNETGRAANRRTRIVVLPQLDQFFKLLETPKG